MRREFIEVHDSSAHRIGFISPLDEIRPEFGSRPARARLLVSWSSEPEPRTAPFGKTEQGPSRGIIELDIDRDAEGDAKLYIVRTGEEFVSMLPGFVRKLSHT